MTYLELLKIISLMSLVCVGYHITITQIVHHVTNKWPEQFVITNKIGKLLFKPLYACVLCHASIIGSIVFYLFIDFELEIVKYWIIACLVTTWLNGVLYGVYNRIF